MRRVVGWILLQLVLLPAVPTLAIAAQSVRGKLFMVKDPEPGIDAARRRIIVVGMEGVSGGATIVGDPRTAGASVQIVATGGSAQSQSESYPLPAAGWSRVPSNPGAPFIGYRYNDPSPGTRGPVRKALLSRASGKFTVALSIAGANGPGPLPHIHVVPPDPGTGGGAVLTIHGGDSYCVTFGGPAGGNVKNGPSTPPMNKSFRVSRTGSAPTFDAGCVATRPNVVLVLTDDQRWDTLDATHSVNGAPVMPQVMDQLAAQGVTFRNAFLPTPLCTPSRVAFLTGAYAHRTNATTNGYAIPPAQEAATLATWLKDAGYRTGFFGKYMPQVVTATPPGWDEWQAFVLVGNYNYTLANNGNPVSYGNASADYATDVLAQKVVDFIGTPDARPFFAVLAPYSPHSEGLGLPQAADRDVAAFDGVPPFRPPNYDEADISDKPTILLPRQHRATDFLGGFVTYGSWTDVVREASLEALQSVDDAVGRIATALDARGIADDTLIVFTSDNGLHWGEHRLWDAKNAAYEEAIRTPFVVRYPRLVPTSHEVTELVANIDFAPTVAELAGITVPVPVDGRSLLPLLEGQATTWRSDLLLETWSPIGPFLAGVRTDAWKYVGYASGETELYDLLHDPYELTNVSSAPENQALKAALAARVAELQ